MIITVTNSHRKRKARARRQWGEGVTLLKPALGLWNWGPCWLGRAARAPGWRPHTGNATPLLAATGGVHRAGPCPGWLPPPADSDLLAGISHMAASPGSGTARLCPAGAAELETPAGFSRGELGEGRSHACPPGIRCSRRRPGAVPGSHARELCRPLAL